MELQRSDGFEQGDEGEMRDSDTLLYSACGNFSKSASLRSNNWELAFGPGTHALDVGGSGHRLVFLPGVSSHRAITTPTEDGVSVRVFGSYGEKVREHASFRWENQAKDSLGSSQQNLWSLLKLGWSGFRAMQEDDSMPGKSMFHLDTRDVDILAELSREGAERPTPPNHAVPDSVEFAATFPFLVEALSPESHLAATFTLQSVEHAQMGVGVCLEIHISSVPRGGSSGLTLRRMLLDRLPLRTQDGAPHTLWDICNSVHEYVRKGAGLDGQPLSWNDPGMAIMKTSHSTQPARFPKFLLWQHWSRSDREEVLVRAVLSSKNMDEFLGYMRALLGMEAGSLEGLARACGACREAWTDESPESSQEGIEERVSAVREAIPAELRGVLFPFAPPFWAKGISQGPLYGKAGGSFFSPPAIGFLIPDLESSSSGRYGVAKRSTGEMTQLVLKMLPREEGEMDLDESAREQLAVASEEVSADCRFEIEWCTSERDEGAAGEVEQTPKWMDSSFWLGVSMGAANGMFISEKGVRSIISRVIASPQGYQCFLSAIEGLEGVQEVLQKGEPGSTPTEGIREMPVLGAQRRVGGFDVCGVKKRLLERGDEFEDWSLAPYLEMVKPLVVSSGRTDGEGVEWRVRSCMREAFCSALSKKMEKMVQNIANENIGNDWQRGLYGSEDREGDIDKAAEPLRTQYLARLKQQLQSAAKAILELRVLDPDLPKGVLKSLRENIVPLEPATQHYFGGFGGYGARNTKYNKGTTCLLLSLEGLQSFTKDNLEKHFMANWAITHYPQFWSQCLGLHKYAWELEYNIAKSLPGARMSAARAADGVVHSFVAYASLNTVPTDLLAELWMWYSIPEASVMNMASWGEIHAASGANAGPQDMSESEGEEEEGEDEDDEDKAAGPTQAGMRKSDAEVLVRMKSRRGEGERSGDAQDALDKLIAAGPELFSWMPKEGEEENMRKLSFDIAPIMDPNKSSQPEAPEQEAPMEEIQFPRFRANEIACAAVLAKKPIRTRFEVDSSDDWSVITGCLVGLGSTYPQGANVYTPEDAAKARNPPKRRRRWGSRTSSNPFAMDAKMFVERLWRLPSAHWPTVIKALREILKPCTFRNHTLSLTFGENIQRLMLWWFPEFRAIKDRKEYKKDPWGKKPKGKGPHPKPIVPIDSAMAAELLDLAEQLILSFPREGTASDHNMGRVTFGQDELQLCLRSTHNKALTERRLAYLLSGPLSLPYTVAALEGVELEGSPHGKAKVWRVEGDMRRLLIRSIAIEGNDKLTAELVERLGKLGLVSTATFAFNSQSLADHLPKMFMEPGVMSETDLGFLKSNWESLLMILPEFDDPAEKLSNVGKQVKGSILGAMSQRILEDSLGEHEPYNPRTSWRYRGYKPEKVKGWPKGEQTTQTLLEILPQALKWLRGAKPMLDAFLGCLTPNMPTCTDGALDTTTHEPTRDQKRSKRERMQVRRAVEEGIEEVKEGLARELSVGSIIDHLVDTLVQGAAALTFCRVGHVSTVCNHCHSSLNVIKCRFLLSLELAREQKRLAILDGDDQEEADEKMGDIWRRVYTENRKLKKGLGSAVSNKLGEFSKYLLAQLEKEGVPTIGKDEEAAQKWKKHLAKVQAREGRGKRSREDSDEDSPVASPPAKRQKRKK